MSVPTAGGRRRPPERGGLHRESRSSPRRRRRRTATLIVLVVTGLSGIGLGLKASGEPPSPGADQRGSLAADDSGTGHGRPLARSAPVRLDVPSVAIHTDLVTLGLNSDDTLEVPSEPMLAGWYTGSPTAGERGPAIIAGHVDSQSGPAVFYRLGQVELGARIEVTRKDGSLAAFEVTAVRAFAQSDFPTGTVYGDTDRPTLRLITCGNWNDESGEYDGNVVVFAELDMPVS